MADTAFKDTAKAKLPVRSRVPFFSLRREIDRIMDEFDGGQGHLPSVFGEALFSRNAPAIDVVETDKAFELTAELPGFSESEVKIEFANGDLQIKGERKEEKEEKRKDYYFSERRHGSVARRLRIPDTIDTDKIEATFQNGLLAITMPKIPDAQKPVKQIPVKSV